MLSKVEEAAAQMREFAKSDVAKRLQEANEAETRLLVIDKVLDILGWSPEEYKPEQPTSTHGYTDYLLTIERQPRLIVEAKRYGLVAPVSKTLQNPQYTNKYLHNSCGEEMAALLDQCRIYCSDCGIPYALATSGNIWIILVGSNIGVGWGNLRSFVFHSLEDISNRFHYFYDLISRECVANNSLEEKFNSFILFKPRIAIRPRDRYIQNTDLSRIPYMRTIQMFFDTYFGDMTKSDRAEMLEHCYVENRETVEFSKDLRELLEYDAVLDEQDEPIQEVTEDHLQQEIDYQLNSSTPKTILLVGRIGSGKSTFVQKFVREQARPKNNICEVIDLINRATISITQDREEEQHISELILNQLFSQCRDKFDPYDPSVLRQCFRTEVQQFKMRKPTLFERRQEEYLIQEEQYLHELCQDKYKHLVGYVRFVRGRKNKIWIAIDNIDQGSYAYQEFVYTYAHKLSAEAGCVTLITLREDTFLEAQSAGFLNVRSSDFIFRLNAPELRQVVAKRRKFVEHALKYDKLPRYLNSHSRLVGLLNWHIKHLLLGPNDTLRKIIAAFSLGNIRHSLQIIEDYYTSSHSLFHTINDVYGTTEEEPTDAAINLSNEFTHFLQALMLKSDWSYDERDSSISNLFAVDSEEQSSHFIALATLAYLSREQPIPQNNVRVDKLCTDLIFYGYQRHHIEGVVKKLLKDSILTSPKVPVGVFKKLDTIDLSGDAKIAISAKGYYYLNHLSADTYYQTRVAEDTIWYDEDKASAYITALKDSSELQGTHGTEDYLLATNARDIFLQYLRKSWLEEYQLGRARTQSEKIKIINSIIEHRLFGGQITQSVYVRDDDSHTEPEPMQNYQPPLPSIEISRAISRGTRSDLGEANQQLSFLPTESINYDNGFREAVVSLGEMPGNTRVHKSTYLLRVLWAMELAFRNGFTTLRASDIARIINVYGNGEVAAPNVAKFFRNQRNSGEYVHLWKEFPAGCFTINNAGRSFLMSHVDEK